MTRRADRPDPSDAQATAAYIADLSTSLAMLAQLRPPDARPRPGHGARRGRHHPARRQRRAGRAM